MSSDNRLYITDTTLRDGVQSLWGMRCSYHMQEPVMQELGEVGFDSIELPLHCGHLLVSARYFQEDPRELVKMWNDKLSNSTSNVLMAQLGTQVGPHTAVENKTVVRMVYEQFKEWLPKVSEAMYITCTQDEVERVYPYMFPLYRNMGVEPIPYMAVGHGPRHTPEFYADQVGQIAETYKPKRFVIKDVDGLMTPERLRRLYPAMRDAANGIPIELHSHGMNGLNTYNAVVGMELGLRRFTTCVPPLANGSSHVSIYDLVKNAEHMGIPHNIDIEKCKVIEERLRKAGSAFGNPVDNHHLPFDLQCYDHQIPGGVISNTRVQLEELGIPEKLEEVLEEIPRILEDLGYPVMITPFSQFIVTQAALNVELGRWEQCLDACIAFAAGVFGIEEAGVNDMNPDIKDKLLSLPQAKKILEKAAIQLDYMRSEPSEEECKEALGLSPNESRENFVLKYTLNGFEELNKCIPGGPANYKKYL